MRPLWDLHVQCYAHPQWLHAFYGLKTARTTLKNQASLVEQRLSEFIESFRKDSECVIGILKGRWRVLKTGIRLHGAETADKVWLTCCALHNMLLEADGKSDEWEGELGGQCRENCPPRATLCGH